MALIRDIVFSKQQPFDRNCLWISPDGMYVYNKGKWICVVDADLKAIRNTIADEVARAVEAEETNADAIAAETTRATEAEEALSQAITDAVESIISNLEYSDSYETGLFVGNVTCTDGSLSIEKKALSLIYDSDSKTLSLSDGTTTFGSIDATAFIMDGMIDSVTYDADAKSLIFVFNTDSGKETISVDISDLVDIYTAGDGLILSDNEFSVVVDADSESFLTVSSSGVKLSGVQDAIDSAVETESTRAKAAEAALKVILQLSGDSTHLTLESEVAEDGATTYTIGESDVASASDLEALSETVDNIIDWYEA